MNPYDRNGHLALDNTMSTYCRRCGRASALWDGPCDNQRCEEDEFDEFGARTRVAT
jgi:protein tyrosine phosphatase (PTP) superfamily phosphohydrolase (DUF442 family)